MSDERRPVHGRSPVEVEEASGAASSFDGNHTDDVVSWMFPNEGWTEEGWKGTQETLMRHTVWGHLAWVVFPPQGFRL